MRLAVFQSMWGMEELPRGSATHWTFEEQIDLIVKAGFDGVGVDFVDFEAATRVCRLAADNQLSIQVLCFPETIDDLKPVLESVQEIGREHVHHINILPKPQPFTVAECLPYLEGWQELADAAGIELHIETHRACMTNDLLFTLQLIEAAPWIKLTADLSHYVVGRAFPWPVDKVNDNYIHRITDRAFAYHGRVAAPEHTQVPISFPHYKPWLDVFAKWWKDGFQSFRERAPEDATLTFTSELGPPSYWFPMTGPDGVESSDRWEEAKQLGDVARELWGSLD